MPHRVQQTYLQRGSTPTTDLNRVSESGIAKLVEETMCDTSTVKRERDRKKLNKLTVQRMREELPVYTMQEIRMHRMSYWEALIVELKEKGYNKTIEYLHKIFLLEEQNDQLILKSRRYELEKLLNFIKTYEMYLNQGDTYKACSEFLKGAVFFAFLSKEWWWLGDQLLLDCIDISSKYQQKKYEAFSRFCYAKFKIENLKDFGSMENLLIIAKDLSANEPWVVKGLFPDLKDTLFMQTSLLLYRCFIRKARQLVNNYPEEALALAIQAKKNAGAGCHKAGEMEASLVKATCELNLNRPREAISTLNCTLTQQTSRKSYEGICKVKAALVKAHLSNKDIDTAYVVLNELRELITKYNFRVYLAVAYKTFGQYYLEQGEPHIADPFITEALLMLEECDTNKYLFSADILLMKNLEAIAKGLGLMPDYIKHIRQAGEPGPDQEKSTSILINWKNERQPFWSRQDQDASFENTKKSRIMLQDTSKAIKPIDLMDPSTKLKNVENKLTKLMGDPDATPVIELMPKKEVTSSASASEPISSPNT